MNVNEVVQYWLESAAEDWPIAEHLLASGDYHYVLFIEARYPEGPPTARRRYTREYAVRELERIREVGDG